MLSKGMEMMAKQLVALIPPDVFDMFKSVVTNVNVKVDSIEKSLTDIKAQNALILKELGIRATFTNGETNGQTPAPILNGRIPVDDSGSVNRLPKTGVASAQHD